MQKIGKTDKNLTIQTLRGLAILLVVIGHVIGSAPDGGMRIDYPSLWRYLYSWIDYIQMPIFTAIAGWVYALKVVAPQSFLWGKFKRLIIPMASVATLYFLVQYFTPGTNNKGAIVDIWRIYLFPYTYFWYLQSLFVIFVIVVFIDKYFGRTSLQAWWGVLIASFALYWIQIASIIPQQTPNLFGFKGALEQLPYFVVGMGVQRFGNRLFSYKRVFGVLAFVGVVLLQVMWFCPGEINQVCYKLPLPIWQTATLFLLFSLKLTNKILIYLGLYAYAIYLFHGFGSAGGRILLSYIDIDNQLIVFALSTIIALFTPILVDKILSKNRYAGVVFLGKKLKK